MKPSLFLAGACWISLFAMIWSLVLGYLPLDIGRGVALLFFFVVALFSSVTSSK